MCVCLCVRLSVDQCTASKSFLQKLSPLQETEGQLSQVSHPCVSFFFETTRGIYSTEVCVLTHTLTIAQIPSSVSLYWASASFVRLLKSSTWSSISSEQYLAFIVRADFRSKSYSWGVMSAGEDKLLYLFWTQDLRPRPDLRIVCEWPLL